MNSRQRVLGAFDRGGCHRIPVKHEGTPEMNRVLMQRFGLSNLEQLVRVVGRVIRRQAARTLASNYPEVSVRKALLRIARQAH